MARTLLTLLTLGGLLGCGGSGGSSSPPPPPSEVHTIIVRVLPPLDDSGADVTIVRTLAFLLEAEGAQPPEEPTVEIVLGLSVDAPFEIPLELPALGPLLIVVDGFTEDGDRPVIGATATEGPTPPPLVEVQLGPAEPSNTPPEVAITSPEAGASFLEGQVISVRGTATDAEDGTALSIFWSSDLQGPISVDPPDAEGNVGFDTTGFAVGTHVLTLLALDSLGASASAESTFEVRAATNGPLEIDTIRPRAGPLGGGTLVTIRGTGFTRDTVVFFGDRLALPAVPAGIFIGPEKLRMYSPPGARRGFVDVLLGIPDGPAVVEVDGFRYD